MINYLEPNIVIIDDAREEIIGIHDYYISNGIGCKILNPDLYDGDEFPSIPFADVSIIFLDLYYSEVFDAERCASWIRHIVKAKSFYILVIWTKDSSKSDEVSSLLTDHNVMPFSTLVKNKSDYATNQGYNFDALFQEINKELDSTPALEEILIWKKAIKYSANEIIGHLTRIPSSINDKIKKIIVSHGGNTIKGSANDSYKRQIFFDALDTVLISNSRNSIYGDINELNSKYLYDFTNFVNTGPDKELNSWFHFKLQNSISPDILMPGLISEFGDNDWKKLYSIEDDDSVSEYMSKQTSETVKVVNITLLISRPCDIAQKKFGKNLKLLSGLKIINPIRKSNEKKEFQGGSPRIDSIKMYDHLYFGEFENDVTLLFDFRYSFSVPEEIFIKDFENIKIFNKELLSEIQVDYSSYSSRLGITQII